MNNDVLRLATKAGFYVSDGKIYSPTTNDDLTALMQKFAEAMGMGCYMYYRSQNPTQKW